MGTIMKKLRWRVAVALLCGGTLFVSGVNVFSSASDVARSPSPPVTAQLTNAPTAEGVLSRQLFVSVAKHAKASVVNISSVKKTQQQD